MGRYEQLEGIAIADAALAIEGGSLDDLFETAAMALAEVMVDPRTVAPTVERSFTLSAPSVDLLFFDWLSELVFLKDRDQIVFTRAVAHVRCNALWVLTARLTGGPVDPERVTLRADVKAVTFHEFSVEREPEGWRARVVLDI